MARQVTPEEEIWVMTAEGGKLTGYNSQYLKKLANRISKLPEAERPIKIRKRSEHFYEFWLPDLLRYIDEIGYGPHQDK